MNAVTLAAIHFVGTGAIMWFGLTVGKLMGRTSQMKSEHFKNVLNELYRVKKNIKDFPHRSEWPCEICGETRIDALISVASYTNDDGSLKINIKYCNDKVMCHEKAHSITMWRGQLVGELIKK
jgi:hypothetical protein